MTITESADGFEVSFDKFVFRVPRGDRYTRNDLWVRSEGADFRIGLTDFAQRLAGDMALVQLAAAGSALRAGDELAVVETIKTAVSVEVPVAGIVVSVNETLVEHPEWINEDPYGTGWLALFSPSEPWSGLLTAEAYVARMNDRLVEEDRKRAAKA
jgi:glycine cleavage system H protein